jgi:hydroxylamine dehydrogenase
MRYSAKNPIPLVLIMVSVTVFLMSAWGTELAGPAGGDKVFIERGCIGCHGVSGRGGVGPDLAHTALSFEQFLAQLRKPREQMPPFPLAVVSDSLAETIYKFVKAVPPAPPRVTKKPPEGVQPPDACVECHRKIQPFLVAQYVSSSMFKRGRQNPRIPQGTPEANSCAFCHGVDHSEITRVKGRVSERICAACHATIYKEHVIDAGHSYGPGPAKMGINWERNIKTPFYVQMPRKVMEMGCDPCHVQAGATDEPYWNPDRNQYTDMSSIPYRNGCIACHTRHRFDPAEARRPEACMTCHMGPDHPNWEAYSTSKHGSIYLTDGVNWEWSKSMAQVSYRAPTCAYCHMVYVDGDGKRLVSHHMTRKIIWGMGIQPALGNLTDITQSSENMTKRAEMIKVCAGCHSEVKARGYLESADAHKLMGDALVIQAREIVHGLYREKIIDPSRRSQSAGLLPGDRFVAAESPGGTFFPTALYYDVSTIEREYFDMFFFANLKSYKGAFHMNPDYAWWLGYADVLGHLTRIRDEGQRLRSEHRSATLARILLYGGILLALVILLIGYRVWRLSRGGR